MSDGDSNFEAFLEDTERREAIHDAVEQTTNRFVLFLSERGVVFDATDFTTLANTEVDSVEEVQIQGMAARNSLHARQLAGIKLMTETAALHRKELPYDFKKRLQAQEIADGSTPAWIELIDVEIPGEPLNDDDDLELLLNEMLETSVLRAASDEELRVAKEKVAIFLSSLGVTVLSEVEQYAVSLFGLYSSLIETRPHQRGSTREDVQIFALKNALDMGIWSQVIDHFFGDE